MTPTIEQVFGLDHNQLIDYRGVQVHQALMPALADLERACENRGFQLGIASAFRSFERQLKIWNAKASGQRPLLDEHGVLLERAALSDRELLWTILRWSALPGASRHHWGTDIDVFDARCLADGYQVQLTQAETQNGGVFGDFHQWLNDYLEGNSGFFRPYTALEGGVAPEPWHLSWAPLARDYQRALHPESLRIHLANSDIALKPLILQHFDEIYARYVWVPWQVYPLEP